MNSADVQALVEAEIGDKWSQSNTHGVDLRKCLIPPRKVACHNTFPKLRGGKPLELWIVLQEKPGQGDGYLIVFDETRRLFGLAYLQGDTPAFLGFHGTFLNTLEGT